MLSAMPARTFAPLPPRGGTQVRSLWARMLAGVVEESTYGEKEFKQGRSLARGGHVGAISLADSQVWAAVTDRGETWVARVAVSAWETHDSDGFAEVVASGAGWWGQLVAGVVPDPMLDALDELGVEVVPDVGDLTSSCGCDAWVDPCQHALALLTQVVWLVERDPLVLPQWRGASAAGLAPRPAAPAASPVGVGEVADDEDMALALEAAERAGKLLEAMADPDGDVERWL